MTNFAPPSLPPQALLLECIDEKGQGLEQLSQHQVRGGGPRLRATVSAPGHSNIYPATASPHQPRGGCQLQPLPTSLGGGTSYSLSPPA